MQNIDILYIINSDVTINELILFIEKTNKKSYFFLTTHYIFEEEIKILKSKFSNKTIINRDFTYYFDDKDMNNFDDEALQYSYKKNYFDNTLFMSLSVKNKNQYVKNKLLNIYKFIDIYCEDGIGINKDIWVNSKNELNENNFIKNKISKFKRIVTKRKKISFLNYKNDKYLFFGTTKRIKFVNEITLEMKDYNYLLLLILLKFNYFKNFKLCFATHEYDKRLIDFKNKDIFMVIDGYMSPNYPKTNIELFRNVIVVTDKYYNSKWFYNYNISINKPFPFQEVSYFKEVEKPYIINKVVLLMNHTGDWTSLINRSDDDFLLEAFCRLAKFFQNIEFIVRLHPTAIHELHNGKEYNNRIYNYIKILNLDNLSISDKNLNEDLERGDLFFSEYSNTLLDAISIGKIGVISNMTKRRNFMQEFVDLGFHHIDSNDELYNIMSNAISSDTIKNIITKQNIAVKKYNNLQKEYFNV